MFVHSAEFVRRHHKSPTSAITIFGTEKMADTLRLCRLNLAVHGLSGDIREASGHYDDPHKLIGRFDFVMANPPFNQSEVDRAKLVNDALPAFWPMAAMMRPRRPPRPRRRPPRRSPRSPHERV
jgi:type I restriction enzyme M protein